MATHLFLSYSSKDVAYAEKLETELKSNDYMVWRDQSDLPVGDSWKRQIEQALQGAWAVMLMMSPDSKQSDWVANEIEYARQNKIPIIPILLRGEVWIEFLGTQYADVRGREDQPLPHSVYKVLLKLAPPVPLKDELGPELIEGNSPQRVGLIPKLEQIARKVNSPRGRDARGLIMQLSQDPDEYVRNAALTALKRLEGVYVAPEVPVSSAGPTIEERRDTANVRAPGFRPGWQVGIAAAAVVIAAAILMLASNMGGTEENSALPATSASSFSETGVTSPTLSLGESTGLTLTPGDSVILTFMSGPGAEHGRKVVAIQPDEPGEYAILLENNNPAWSEHWLVWDYIGLIANNNRPVWEIGESDAPPDFGEAAFAEFCDPQIGQNCTTEFTVGSTGVEDFAKDLNDGLLPSARINFLLARTHVDSDLMLVLSTLYSTHKGAEDFQMRVTLARANSTGNP